MVDQFDWDDFDMYTQDLLPQEVEKILGQAQEEFFQSAIPFINNPHDRDRAFHKFCHKYITILGSEFETSLISFEETLNESNDDTLFFY